MKKEQLKADNYKLCNIDQVKVDEILDKYPSNRKASAVIPLLHYVQKKSNGWLPVPEIERVAEILDMPYMKVYEVASFYTMFNLKPVGKKLLQLCHTTPCWLRGSDEIEKSIFDTLKIKDGETTPDNMFTLMKVECLGACINAPMMQINNDYYEDLDIKQSEKIIDEVLMGNKPKPGSYRGRLNNAPENNRKTLMDIKNA